MYHRCPGCSTIFTNENIDHLVVTENDAIAHRNKPERFEIVLDRTGINAEATPGPLIDFGCGSGEFAGYLRKLGLYVVPIDKDTDRQLENCDRRAFGGAFMIEVIEHLTNPIEIVDEIGWRLRKNGFLYIESTFAESIFDHTNHPYVDPKIGHRTILSMQALISATQDMFTAEIVNPHVIVLRRK